MHNEEIRVVDVELHRLEKVLDRLLLRSVAIDEVFGSATQDDLPGHGDLRILFKADGRFGLVTVVKNNGDACFGYTCLATLVDQVLEQSVSVLNSNVCAAFLLFTWRFVARTVLMFVMPKTKHIESRIFDFPLPFRPVIELKLSSLTVY